MRKKKDLPIVILRVLEPFVTLQGDKFEVVDPEDNLLKVIDKDLESEFYFTIEKYQKNANSGAFNLLLNRVPNNINDIKPLQNWTTISELPTQFENWLKLLEEYESLNSFYDDPIAKAYQDELFAEFEFIKDEDYEKPLKINQILGLDLYFEKVQLKLEEFKTEKNSAEIEEILGEIDNLRNNLTTKSRKFVIEKLTRIWGKIAKQGTKFIKEFLTESKKELIKQGVKGIIEFVKENGVELLNG